MLTDRPVTRTWCARSTTSSFTTRSVSRESGPARQRPDDTPQLPVLYTLRYTLSVFGVGSSAPGARQGGGKALPACPRLRSKAPVGLSMGRYIITISGHGNGATGPHRGVVMSAIAAVITGRLMTAGKAQDVFPPNCPYPWQIWTPSTTRFFGPTRVCFPEWHAKRNSLPTAVRSNSLSLTGLFTAQGLN